MTRFSRMLLGVGAAGVLVLVAGSVLADEPILGERQIQVFGRICAHCHVEGPLSAPVIGDAEAWASRKAQGFEVLVAHTVDGFGDMPPLGTCSYCTEDDLRRLVAFMAGFDRVPAAPATDVEVTP